MLDGEAEETDDDNATAPAVWAAVKVPSTAGSESEPTTEEMK